jgi:hypothetical protein
MKSTMKKTFRMLGIAVLGASLQTMNGADLTGKVTLKGTPPPEIPITMDPACGKLRTDKVTTRHYVTSDDGGLANVFVYVKSGVDKKFDPPADKPLLNQEGCMYEPYVLGVQTGQNFDIKNSDPLLHNVHATPSPASGNKGFNLGQPLKGMATTKNFPNPEVPVRFKCDVHPWMFAYVAVVPHPYFAVTDEKGNFKISGLPAGKYVIEAFHEKTHRTGGAITQEITVDGDAKLDFAVELQ